MSRLSSCLSQARFHVLWCALTLGGAFTAVHADLLISEYVEGSSFNKVIELYNTDVNGFDLDANSCELRGYQNGSATADYTVDLNGMVPAESTWVIANPAADAAVLAIADQTGGLDFNGDDAIGLYCGGNAIDIIGQIGFDPGNEWGTGDVSTRDNTLRRQSSVCIGDDNGADAFDPSMQWDGFANNTFDGLGAHAINCGPDVTPPTIGAVSPSTTGPTPATEIEFTVQFSENISDFDDLSDVTVNTTGSVMTGGVSFVAITGSSSVVTVSGITGTGTLSLTVLANSVVDGAGNPNVDTLTSAEVSIDPNVVITTPNGLLLSEIVVGPDGAEFIEIHNPTADLIDLGDVYLTDATFAPNSVYYYQVVNGAGGGGAFEDFHARFPDGSSIAAGAYQTVALAGSDAFLTAHGQLPDYELFEDAGSSDAVADLREAFAGSISAQGLLSDGEVLVLYHWDGQSDLVGDLDYALWGDAAEAVDKSGVMIDGPDGDASPTAYLADTAVDLQAVIARAPHALGNSWQRTDLTEGPEVQVGGNGLDGHDETSELFPLSWGEGLPTPGTATDPGTTAPGPSLLINEVNAVDAVADEFIELFDGGRGQTATDGLVLVLYDSSATSYAAIDLDGARTDLGGYLIIGGSNTSADLLLPSALVDGEVAAVALYIGDDSDFASGTSVTTTGLIDALVYDNGQPDLPALLVLMAAGQAQINEDANGMASSESMQRCPNGSGGRRVSETVEAVTPSLGGLNNSCPIGDYYALVDDSSAAVLRSSLHETIDDHQWYPYSSSSTDTWDILDMADENPADANTILDVYKNAAYTKAGGGNSFYNREHTWPRSIGLGDTGANLNHTATDAHNLRLSDIGYNSDRGSKPFDFCSMASGCSELTTNATNGQGGGSGVYPGNSNWTTANDGNMGSFEVWHDRRGDIARTIFYMDLRYEGGSHGVTGLAEPNLILTDDRNLIQGTTGSEAYMGLLSVLLQWHQEDPVDSRELDRNEVVFSFQGNRNPFADHPEWVDCLYSDICTGVVVDIFEDGFE